VIIRIRSAAEWRDLRFQSTLQKYSGNRPKSLPCLGSPKDEN
jgi:hypothetical protein